MTPLDLSIQDTIRTYGTACGGNWTAMLLSTIRNMPCSRDLLAAYSDDYVFTINEAYNLLEGWLSSQTGYYCVPGTKYHEWRKCTSIAGMANIASCELTDVDYTLHLPSTR